MGQGRKNEERDLEQPLELGGVEILSLLALAWHEGAGAVGAFDRVVAVFHPGFDSLRVHAAPAVVAVQLLGQVLPAKLGKLSIQAPARRQQLSTHAGREHGAARAAVRAQE